MCGDHVAEFAVSTTTSVMESCKYFTFYLSQVRDPLQLPRSKISASIQSVSLLKTTKASQF
ncbi:hypothetical protein AN958_00005 [Leucoagaricus sp. SymC.cos]|nr:hypothetical protein AN958_00005 [Leucoagaricus sp. SymC.cos]